MGAIILDVGPSEKLSVSQDLCITAMSLQFDTTVSARGHEREVSVWAQAVGHDESRCTIGTLSREAPVVELRPRLIVNDKFLLGNDAVVDTVRFYARVPQPPTPPPHSVIADDGAEESSRVDAFDDDDEGEVEQATVVEEDAATWAEFRPLTEEEEAERYDSDNGDEEDEDEDDDEPRRMVRDVETEGEGSTNTSSIPYVAPPPGTIVPAGQFLGPARFAVVDNTAGFMRVAASGGQDEEGDKEILVFYRYTRSSRTWTGRRGVEACRRTKLHRLRFIVPPAGDVASSLAWAGASLGPIIYPALFRRQLQDLWVIMVARAISIIPPRATRIQVVVDAAILRREDYTTDRMAHVRGALEAGMQEAWPELYHVSMDLHLPEPVRRHEDDDEYAGDDDVRAAKRRKIADDEEECSVCFDPLQESDLAAWPGCRHVFHGACVEKTLARSDACPLCRNNLCADTSTS